MRGVQTSPLRLSLLRERGLNLTPAPLQVSGEGCFFPLLNKERDVRKDRVRLFVFLQATN
jgi:hypothetical protein